MGRRTMIGHFGLLKGSKLKSRMSKVDKGEYMSGLKEREE